VARPARPGAGLALGEAAQPQPAPAEPGDLAQLLLGLVQAGQHRLGVAELVEVARRFDVSEDDTLMLQLDYLEVVARKPAWL
jgi:hypothetical protein